MLKVIIVFDEGLSDRRLNLSTLLREQTGPYKINKSTIQIAHMCNLEKAIRVMAGGLLLNGRI
jgi:hypothetical protein